MIKNKRREEIMEIKENDWLFYEFKLVKVKSTKEGYLIVSDGWIESGNASPEYCFPMTLTNKRLSDYFEELYQKLRKHCRNLNWPDIHRWMVTKWAEACLIENKAKARHFSDEATNYVNEIISKAEDLSFETVGGMNPFKP